MPSFELLEQRNLLSLVGVIAELNPGVPDFNYDATGRLTYTAPSESVEFGAFDATATPTTVIFTIGGRPVSIKDPRAFGLHIRLDAQGNVVGGVDGPDLQVDGWIDMNRNNIQDAGDYAGVLVTGEILQFGFHDSGGPNDSYDFRFQFTGGSLAPFFQGKDIGLTMTSLNSTFTGDFSAGFVGWAQGLFGPLSLNQAPVPQDQQVETLEDTAVSGQLTASDGPMDAGKLAYALAQAPAHGDVIVNPDGSFTYTPLADYNGPDSFSFAVSDWQLTSTGTVSIDVTPVNDAPVAQGQDVNTLEDTAVSGQLVASDIDSAALVFALAQAPAHGQVVVNADGSFTYNPAADYSGPDSFSFIASDGELSSLAEVSIAVAPVNDAPVAHTQAIGTSEDTPVAINLAGSDLETAANGLIFTIVNAPSNGTLSLSDNHVVYTPGPGYSGLDSFSFSVTDTGDPVGSQGNAITSQPTTVDLNVVATPKSTLQGLVWEDFNNDGEVDFNEQVITGVTIELTGTDDLGRPVSRIAVTDEDGVYMFDGLRPSNAAGYRIHELQPTDWMDGQDILGMVGGASAGVLLANDIIGGIVMTTPGTEAINYNFAELEGGQGRVIGSGQTATIGFWQNKNGQALIKGLNGGPNATQLGDWLAATFPNLYGDLAGKTNAQVADYYKKLFSSGKKCSLLAVPKLDAQIMAVALATYVTNSTLAGTTAARYGFNVTEDGVGVRTINVTIFGAAFGFDNWTVHRVLELLWATDARSTDGQIYDIDGNGRTNCEEYVFQVMANVMYTLINELGHIC